MLRKVYKQSFQVVSRLNQETKSFTNKKTLVRRSVSKSPDMPKGRFIWLETFIFCREHIQIMLFYLSSRLFKWTFPKRKPLVKYPNLSQSPKREQKVAVTNSSQSPSPRRELGLRVRGSEVITRSEPLQSGTTFLDVEVSLVLPLVSNSQAKRLTKIQAFSLAISCMLHSYWLLFPLLQ